MLTLEFCNSLKRLLENELDLPCCINQSKKSKEKNTNTRSLSIGGNIQAKYFLSWIYGDSNIFLNRKFSKYLQVSRK